MTPTVWQRLIATALLLAMIAVLANISYDQSRLYRKAILAAFTLAAACLVIGALGATWT